jgi:hypothetical protein
LAVLASAGAAMLGLLVYLLLHLLLLEGVAATPSAAGRCISELSDRTKT